MKKLIAGLIQVTLLVVAGMTLAGQAWSQDGQRVSSDVKHCRNSRAVAQTLVRMQAVAMLEPESI